MTTGFREKLLGGGAIFGSAVAFYLSTVVVRLAQDVVKVDAYFFTFARFFFGFLMLCGTLLLKRKWLNPVGYTVLVLRGIANAGAVLCFYKAVELTTAAEANVLNMTYPIFLVFLTWVFVKAERDLFAYAMSLLAFVGIVMIINPKGMSLSLNQLWGLSSGFFGALAVMCLNVSRQGNDTETVLFFMFASGLLLLAPGIPGHVYIPSMREGAYLLTASLFGLGAQYLLTWGQQYATAVETGVISSSRILIAALCGPFIVGESPLGLVAWLGAAIIFFTNVTLAVRKKEKAQTRADQEAIADCCEQTVGIESEKIAARSRCSTVS